MRFPWFRRRPDHAFRHIVTTDNIGDRACGPYRYFDFPGADVQADKRAFRPARVMIYGGGHIFTRLEEHLRDGLIVADHVVGWGLGVTLDPASPRFQAVVARTSLLGIRDHHRAVGCDYAPCVSCMHPFFDAPPEPDSDVVLFYHRNKSDTLPRDTGVPERSNHDGTLMDALRFIARGATVVSNSYHGTYWALLMGRKVLCLPFNPKFDGFRMPPGFSTIKAWRQDLDRARAQPDFLADCRAATLTFRDKVMTL